MFYKFLKGFLEESKKTCKKIRTRPNAYAETKAYQKIPEIISFLDDKGNDTMQADIDRNYRQIKADVENIVNLEMERIKADDNLKHLVKDKEKNSF